jgi:LacI family transcriptional regulator
VPYVVTDDYRGARDAVEHLVQLGHRQIAHIGGAGDQTSIRRAAGYRDAMRDSGLAVPGGYIAQREYSRNWGYHAALELCQLSVPPTALFCGNDAVASGALRYLRSAGLRCPEDVSVIGYSNSDLSQDLQLSSVHQPIVGLAEAVWRNLSLAMQHKPVPRETRLETMLIVRKTTGRCPES